MRAAVLFSALVFAIPSLVSAEETSADLARHGRTVWAAFTCSAIAVDKGDPDARARLFELGYERGKTFLDALVAGNINESDFISTVPIGVTLRLEGPSIDFMLGRIWEGAVEGYFDWRTQNCESCVRDESLKALIASNRFTEMNCEILQ